MQWIPRWTKSYMLAVFVVMPDITLRLIGAPDQFVLIIFRSNLHISSEWIQINITLKKIKSVSLSLIVLTSGSSLRCFGMADRGSSVPCSDLSCKSPSPWPSPPSPSPSPSSPSSGSIPSPSPPSTSSWLQEDNVRVPSNTFFTHRVMRASVRKSLKKSEISLKRLRRCAFLQCIKSLKMGLCEEQNRLKSD